MRLLISTYYAVRNYWRRKRREAFSQPRLIVIISFFASILCLPWAFFLPMSMNDYVFGLPFTFFISVLLFPLLVLALLYWFSRMADQIERQEK